MIRFAIALCPPDAGQIIMHYEYLILVLPLMAFAYPILRKWCKE